MYRVQTGAFRLKLNANRLSRKLKRAGFDNFPRKVGGLWKVQVGAFSNKSNAQSLKDQLKAKGFDAFVVDDGSKPKPEPPKEKNMMPRNTWWGVKNGRTTAGYKVRLWGGKYPWGCPPGKYRNGRLKGNSLHHGLDSAAPTGSPVYAWGDGIVLFTRYAGAYRRYIQIYYPKANMTHTLGHMLNRNFARAGQRVRRGTLVGYVGTRYDGINHSHIHHRVAYGKHTHIYGIPACKDVNPIILWNKLK